MLRTAAGRSSRRGIFRRPSLVYWRTRRRRSALPTYPVPPTAVPLTDAGTGTDAATVVVADALVDAGTGADAATLAATGALTDAGTGTDVASLAATDALTDAGTGSDSATLAVTDLRSLTDSGAGSEAVGIVDIPRPPTPGQLFDLSRWHLTLPTDDGTGSAEQIDQPALATYTDANYYSENGRIVCVAPVVGATTSGASGATRCEHRERESDYSLSAWNPNTTGRRQLTITTRADGTSITGGTLPRQEVIIFQIHGASGTPPIYLTAEWTSSGTPLATPRVRMFVSGTGMANANVVTGITPTTDVTIRCRVVNAVLSLWVVIGQVSDLPPITATPTFTAPTANFTDQSAWYFKWGSYNKTAIDSGSTGQAEARISYYELLQPGDPDPVTAPRRLFLPF